MAFKSLFTFQFLGMQLFNVFVILINLGLIGMTIALGITTSRSNYYKVDEAIEAGIKDVCMK